MRIVFFGTDEFAKELLAFLLEQKLNIVAVVTRADKPKGRSLKVEAPPVKELCLKARYNGPIYQPIKASADEFVEELKSCDADLFVVVSYGQILKQMVLDIPKIGTINVHPSLLPKYRGPSPIQSVVLAGEKNTGVAIMEMELAMDAGGVIRVDTIEVPKQMTFGELEITLIDVSKRALFEVIQDIAFTKKIISTPQNESLATYTKKIHAENSFVNWTQNKDEILNFVRGMNPRPGARMFVEVEGKKLLLKIFKATESRFNGHNSGEIIYCDKDHGFVIACGDGSIALEEVQLEGKKKMSIKDFINGTHGILIGSKK